MSRRGVTSSDRSPDVTRLRVHLIGDGRRADLTRRTIFGSVQIPFNRSGSLSAQLGARGIAVGELVHGAARDTIGPGFVAAGVGTTFF